ncbi:unnamed protein product [Rotaria socialis]|uniref:NudC domain-containing protein 1 n=1 Tax=Rotaria socialis TaxID=392032 RepID=A0A817QV34_9BILA|nr:unnamed protein product [Rotaria socialis]CAF3308133.1 unnamed protein product [Rotaria socialis]CAF3373116.1 unnamed protein product [Rotaria socialis]CAF3477228.1 unnamed protein product [Rotaria socialis]CAF3595963.1 unnamed protein product [Rotaria socialis]
MTEWREFRPEQKLLNSNFDGYRLTLEPLAQYSIKFDNNIHTQKDIELDNDLYSYNSIKGFKSLNQLYINSWKPNNNDLYYFDQMHSIQQVDLTSNQSFSHLQQPTIVYQLPKTSLYGSMIFISDSLVFVCDGRSKLSVLNTNSPKWKLLHDEDFDEYLTSPIRLIHAVSCEGYLHAIIGFIQAECQLLWATFSIGSSSEIKLIRRRILNGKKWPDFVAIESNGHSVYVAAEGLYTFKYDSLIEVKKEEPPKEPVVEKIESPYHYIWSQTHNMIEIEIDITTSESQQWSVNIESNHLKCSVDDDILIDAILFDNIDPKESSYVITKDKSNQLTITLQKSNVGSFWSEIFKEGKSMSGDIKMNGLPETNNTDETDELKQPYNSQQLEECDQYSNDTDVYLSRFDGDTHAVTHQALVNNQILFTKLNPPSLCIRHDVDGLIWHINSITSNDQLPWTHEATLNAFGYVQASKQNRKFISTPTDYSYALISDTRTHLYIYKQNTPTSNLPGTSLRNRKTGKVVDSIAKQHMISLENHNEILGLITTNEQTFILTDDQLFIISV